MSTNADGAAQESAAAVERPQSVLPLAVVAWLWVGIPFAYGLVQLIAKIPALFGA